MQQASAQLCLRTSGPRSRGSDEAHHGTTEDVAEHTKEVEEVKDKMVNAADMECEVCEHHTENGA